MTGVFPFDKFGRCVACGRRGAHCDGPKSPQCVEYMDREWASIETVTPKAVRHYLGQLSRHNPGEVTEAHIVDIIEHYPGCGVQHVPRLLEALLRVHATLITDETTQCPVCGELLEHPLNDFEDGESLGHTIDCPLDIGGP